MTKFHIWICVSSLFFINCSYIEKSVNRRPQSNQYFNDFYISGLNLVECQLKFRYVKHRTNLITLLEGKKVWKKYFLVKNNNCYANIVIRLEKKKEPHIESITLYDKNSQKDFKILDFMKVANKNIGWGREYTWSWKNLDTVGKFIIKTYLF